jgi:ParB family chromosome partitioning protein
VQKQLSVRDSEQLTRRLVARSSGRKRVRALDPDIRALQQKLSERLGARVRINHGRRGKGRLSIEYNSLDELEGILGRIR